jgi:sodium-coupled neutral amino acid transporter 11
MQKSKSVFSSKGDIFENYCHKDDLMNLIRLLYAFIIMFSYPLESFVVREVLENTFFSEKKGCQKLHTFITIVIAFCALFLSYLTDCLGVVLELNGALIATSLAYILPSACAILINLKYEKNIEKIILPSIIFLIGFGVLVSGLVSIIHKILIGYECSHGLEMAYCNTRRFVSSSSFSQNQTSLYSNINYFDNRTTNFSSSFTKLN